MELQVHAMWHKVEVTRNHFQFSLKDTSLSLRYTAASERGRGTPPTSAAFEHTLITWHFDNSWKLAYVDDVPKML